MLGERHSEREESVNSKSARSPESTNSNMFGNTNEEMYLNHREMGFDNNADPGHNSASSNSNIEINRISSELTSRLSRQMDEMMSSVNVQIQRAISDAISNQNLPQIQNALRSESGHLTQNRRNVPAERPEIDSEDNRDGKSRENLRSELIRECPNGESTDRAYDMVTGGNESPSPAPEFLMGRMPSRSHLNQSHDDFNPQLDTTIPAQKPTATAADSDPINKLADVLISMQNRPTAQQLTIQPVNSNTMTFDGKSEKFELFEDLFLTMIKMQPETSEQMKINQFHSLIRENALQTFRNISTANRQTLEDVLVIFRRNYVKPKSHATAKHKWHHLVFDPNTMKLPDFLRRIQSRGRKSVWKQRTKDD